MQLTRGLCQTISICGGSIDEFDEGSIFAEQLHLLRIDILATRRFVDRPKDLLHILSSFGSVQVLELNVHLGLCLHVRHISLEWQTTMCLIKLLDGIGNYPEACLLLDLEVHISVFASNAA